VSCPNIIYLALGNGMPPPIADSAMARNIRVLPDPLYPTDDPVRILKPVET